MHGVDHYDRCGRRCNCVNRRLENCCRVRRDYAGLSSEERLSYINIFLTAVRDPVYGPWYTRLIDTYASTFLNNITQSTTPSVSQYFMFNRYFLLEFEDLLRDFRCSLTIPFYDWTPFPVAPMLQQFGEIRMDLEIPLSYLMVVSAQVLYE